MASQEVPSADPSKISSLFVGVFLAGNLWGLSCSQAFQYITSHPKDHTIFKILVGVIFCADTAHNWLLFVALYGTCVVNFGNTNQVETYQRGNVASQFAIMNGIALIVQGMYIYRIWILSAKKYWFIGFPGLVWLAEFALAIVNVYSVSWGESKLVALLTRQKKITPAYFGIASSLDIIMSVMLLYLLMQKRNASEFPRTQSLLKKLALFMVSTNMLTASFTMAVAIVYIRFPSKFYMIPFFHLVTPLYTTSFFGILNMRPYLKAQYEASGIASNQLTTSAVRVELSQFRVRSADASWSNADVEDAVVTPKGHLSMSGRSPTSATSAMTDVKMSQEPLRDA